MCVSVSVFFFACSSEHFIAQIWTLWFAYTTDVILCFLSCKIRKLNWLTIFKSLWKRCAQPTRMNGRQFVVRSVGRSFAILHTDKAFIVYHSITLYSTHTSADFFFICCFCFFLAAFVDYYLMLVPLFNAPNFNECEWNENTNEKSLEVKSHTLYTHTQTHTN